MNKAKWSEKDASEWKEASPRTAHGLWDIELDNKQNLKTHIHMKKKDRSKFKI